MSVFSGERHPGPSFQPPIDESAWNPTLKSTVVGRPTDEGNEGKASGLRRRDPGNLVGIGEVTRVSHRVDQDDALEFFPGIGSTQNRQEWSKAGARRKTPQRGGRRYLRHAEKTVGSIEQPHRIVRVECGKPRRKRPLRPQ